MDAESTGKDLNRQAADRSEGTDGWWTFAADLHCTVRSSANVLLTGPRELAQAVARKVHEESGWRHGPFTLIDCTRPDGLDSRVAEALSGLSASGEPYLRLSQDGTVFLQEVGLMPGELQEKLADLLATQGERRRRRVIASTSEWLLQRVLEGTFNDRLFYRLNAIHLLLTPGPDQVQGAPAGATRWSFSCPLSLPPEGYSSRRASAG